MTRVYVSVDMEGVAGVVHAEQVRRGQPDFDSARKLMTLEANAAALGAFDAGADEVLINDAHGDMRNLILDDLDRRVQVLSGMHKPYSMVEGVQQGRFDVALFVGYHGGVGTLDAVLDHTYWSTVVSQIRVNGVAMNEAGLNALVAGASGTPVGLVTGDEATCQQCQALLGEVDTVTVKWGVGRLAARSLHPAEARDRIRAGAERAVQEHGRFSPFVMEAPYLLEIDVHSAAMADAAAVMPGCERPAVRQLRYQAEDVDIMFRALLSLLLLADVGRV